MKRWLKCVRRSLCDFDRLDDESQKEVMALYLIGGALFFTLLGYLWSLLPGVSSFTQITWGTPLAWVAGVLLNAVLIGAIVWFVALCTRVIYTGATTGIQVVRRLADDESAKPGEFRLPRRYVVPPPLSDLVVFGLFFLGTFLVCTLGGYFSALAGLAYGGLLTSACVNLTAASLTVMCHRTTNECECAAVTAVATFMFCFLLALIVFWLSGMKEKIVPPEGLNEAEAEPLTTKGYV